MDDLIADNVGAGNIDGGDSTFFMENGNYQAMHTINMGFKKLLNLSTPSEPYKVATKEYVDDKDAALKNYIDDQIYMEKKPFLIAVSAQYIGQLRRNKYQFGFAGDIDHTANLNAGFLVPHSGIIKKMFCTYPVIPSFIHVCIYFWFPLWLFLELDFLLWNIVLEVSGPVYHLITKNYATDFNMNFLEVLCHYKEKSSLHSVFTS